MIPAAKLRVTGGVQSQKNRRASGHANPPAVVSRTVGDHLAAAFAICLIRAQTTGQLARWKALSARLGDPMTNHSPESRSSEVDTASTEARERVESPDPLWDQEFGNPPLNERLWRELLTGRSCSRGERCQAIATGVALAYGK